MPYNVENVYLKIVSENSKNIIHTCMAIPIPDIPNIKPNKEMSKSSKLKRVG
jgi:hypothetical protein